MQCMYSAKSIKSCVRLVFVKSAPVLTTRPIPPYCGEYRLPRPSHNTLRAIYESIPQAVFSCFSLVLTLDKSRLSLTSLNFYFTLVPTLIL